MKIKQKNTIESIKKSNNGITLIALVITIIVLIILSTITINIVMKENGILKKASHASDENIIGDVKDFAKLLKANYLIEHEGKEPTPRFIIEKLIEDGKPIDSVEDYGDDNGIGIIIVRGEKVEITGYCIAEEELNKLLADIGATRYIDQDGNEAVIPNGFEVSNKDSENSIKTGLVIRDDSGNEFVWIPINKKTLTVLNTSKKMAELTDGNYKGLLYTYDKSQADYVLMNSSTGYAEPEVTFVDIGNYSSIQTSTDWTQYGITIEKLQSEYNALINSIKKFGGFYVGRYELSIADGKGISKPNVLPSNAQKYTTKTWYGLYNKSKTYSNSSNSVTSNMIWGSCYDAIINFALANGNDGEKITSTQYGNYSGGLKNSGETADDIINNIYDLSGNLFEWTLENRNGNSRTRRGGNFKGSNVIPSGNVAPITRNDLTPWYNYDYDGTRMIIYINYTV